MTTRWDPAKHPRDRRGRFAGRPGWVTGVSAQVGNSIGEYDDLADELRSAGGQVHPDGTVTLYHHTTPAKAAEIRRTGQMEGAEDGVFFTTSPNPESHAGGRGGATVEARVPLAGLQLDDIFDDEAHVRVPTRHSGDRVDATGWLRSPTEQLETALEGHGRIVPDGPYYKLVKIVVPERSRGTGSRLMQQLVGQADRLGVTLTLSPSTDFGGSSTARLERFYRRFGFTSNRGRSRDYDTQALMIRPPHGR